MPVHILPPEEAAKIAAGEVVERPASVVKELVENSLDAGATQITVEVAGGGLTLIRVVDNGSGIARADVENAFQRYATSKITTVGDLEHVLTLGFRGEALPSIASVGEVEVVTAYQGETAGTFLRIRDSHIVEKSDRGAPQGASITVRNLFKSVPARRKFLKSPSAEAGRAVTLVSQYSLAYPHVRFSITVDGRMTFSSQGTGSLRDAVARVHGVEAADNMLEVESGEAARSSGINAVGLVGRPSLSRASRNYVSIFVNRRLVQNRSLAKAVEQAYTGLLTVGRYPIAVLNIEVPPPDVDVNVHPTKAEVRFRDEGAVFTAVQRAVRAALVQSAPVPSMTPPIFSTPITTIAPRTEQQPGLGRPVTHADAANPAPDSTPTPTRQVLPVLRVIGQLNNTYIVAEGPERMYLIDQHAAHERVVFDRLLKSKSAGETEAQGLLEPVTLELSPRQDELFTAQRSTLEAFGFVLEHFGARTYLLRSVPAVMAKGSPRLVLEVLDYMDSEASRGYTWEQKITTSIACHSAVRAGQTLSIAEMEALVRQLEATDVPMSCPHGRPSIVRMTSFQLEKEFHRR